MQVNCSHLRTLWPKPGMEESDYIIAVYRPAPFCEIEEDFVAKGNSLPTDPYLDITFQGKLVNDEKRGPAFVVKSYTTAVRKTRASVLGYLSSGLIKGVGPEIAKRIVDAFGIGAVEILEQDPERLREVKGIGEKTLEQMMESLYNNREIHSIMKYLGQYDISVNKARRIVKKYGAKSLEVVKNDVYHLCEVDGFGFITVDTMAQKMNHPMNTLPRVRAAAEYTLKENRTEGHLYMEPEEFLTALKKNLNHKDASYKFTEADLRPLANEALETEKITYSGRSIYLTKDFDNEKGFAVIMARRLYEERHDTKDKEGAALKGAKFNIYNNKMELVDTIESDRNGFCTSDYLPLGVYGVKEVSSPDYYFTESEMFYCELKIHDDLVKFKVVNKPVHIETSVEKRGVVEAMAGSSILYNFSNIENKSNVPLTEFYWHDILPTEAVRLEKIWTGVWSERVIMELQFKTNLKTGYRTVKKGLLSTVNNEIDCSRSALGLASNEYVTEFKLVFGEVQPAFHAKTGPKIQAKVLDTIENGRKFTNKTDVGGKYIDKIVYDTDGWTVVTYNSNKPKGNLPKTGW